MRRNIQSRQLPVQGHTVTPSDARQLRDATCVVTLVVTGPRVTCPETAIVSLPDDVALHATERAEQLALLRFLHAEIIERLHQIFDERVELVLGDLHAGVGRD